MQGRRIPVIDDKVDPVSVLLEPGDYYGPVTYQGYGPAVWFLLPIARDPDVHPQARSKHHVISPPHTFTEEPDGTLTIRASIGAGRPFYWHGYLTKGLWHVC